LREDSAPVIESPPTHSWLLLLLLAVFLISWCSLISEISKRWAVIEDILESPFILFESLDLSRMIAHTDKEAAPLKLV
jgi:hypothetical protein